MRRKESAVLLGGRMVLGRLCFPALLLGLLFCCDASQEKELLSSSPPLSTSCSLNFSVIDVFPWILEEVKSRDEDGRCGGVAAALKLAVTVHFRDGGSLLLDQDEASLCLNEFQGEMEKRGVTGNVLEPCNVTARHLSSGSECDQVLARGELGSRLSMAELERLNATCGNGLGVAENCTLCNSNYIPMASKIAQNGSASECVNAMGVWIAAKVNVDGPLDAGTALCLFSIGKERGRSRALLLRSRSVGIISGASVGVVVCVVVAGVAWYSCKRAARRKIASRQSSLVARGSSLVWFDMDTLKAATRSFHQDTMIGSGGFGNVFKGRLPDGTTVALKRFKNCSAAGDKDFFHELEVIASVRHRNLVTLRGCSCSTSTATNTSHRVIVLDFVQNGSLQDHLFRKKAAAAPLDWPTRLNIAIGTARGLDYLHNGVKPAILHRDIKCSNILLDQDMNALLADFGLAKFSPEGVTHLSTRAGGTFGYIPPESAYHGQLTDKSDVYSFGIVMLMMLTGSRPVMRSSHQGTDVLINDWAWDMAKKGCLTDLIDPTMDKLPSLELMGRFFFIALLCAHDQPSCRPSISQALNLLENNHLPLPPIPDRSLPLTSSIHEIHSSVSDINNTGSTSLNTASHSFDSDTLASNSSMLCLCAK